MDDRYQVPYDLARQEFRDEVDRLSRVEGKSFALLSTLTLIIGIYGAAIGWLVRAVSVPSGALDWLIIALSAIVLFALMCSWFFLFRAVIVDERAYIAVNGSLMKFYEDNNLTTFNHYMVEQFREAASHNRNKTLRKVTNITRGYFAIITSGICSVALMALVGIYILNAYSNQSAKPSTHSTEVHRNG